MVTLTVSYQTDENSIYSFEINLHVRANNMAFAVYKTTGFFMAGRGNIVWDLSSFPYRNLKSIKFSTLF